MPDTKTNTRPSRKRAEAASPKVEKTTKAKKAVKPETAVVEPEETEETEVELQKIFVDLEHTGDTKTYSKWQPPSSSGCVGTFYAPLGTTGVKVRLEGPAF